MFGDIARARTVSLTAAFIALITAGAWISIPVLLVPVTLQTLFVLLAGAVLKRHGVIPVLAYLALGMMNAPVFHNGLGGVPILLGPTGGYLIGFVFAAFIAGIGFESDSRAIRVLGLIAATIAIYACGLLWLMYTTGIPLVSALVIGVLPFLPGDALKGAAAYLVAERLQASR